jgi:protein-tyrosine-phosphatase
VHPAALQLLAERGLAVEGYRSKSWDEFAAPDAQALDVVISVCDNAEGEVCPIWPGKPARMHWSIPDPAAVEGEGQRQAFEEAFRDLHERISDFLAVEKTSD